MNKKRRLVKYAPLIIYLIIIIYALINFKSFSVDALLSRSPKSVFRAAVFVMLLFMAKSLTVVFPIVVLHILSGFLFPPAAALLINCLGTALCCTVPYVIGRISGADAVRFVEAKIALREKRKAAECKKKRGIFSGADIAELFSEQRSHRFFLPFFLRVVSCLPCDLISLYLGALEFPYLSYVSASVLGTLPGIVPATFVGKNITNPASPAFIAAFLLTVFCSVLSIAAFWIYNKHKKQKH